MMNEHASPSRSRRTRRALPALQPARILALGIGLGLAAGPAVAHYPWLTPAEYAPPAGEPLAFSVGWGHAFPGTDTLAADRLESAELLDAAGQVHAVALGPGTVFATPPLPGAGPWILAVRVAPGYYSRTPQGGQRASRAEHPDAMSCGHSSNAVKALLGHGFLNGELEGQGHGQRDGSRAGALDHPLGHPLEIVPLATEPATTAPFPIRVLRDGAPWQGEVNAVHAGFEGAEGEYPLTVTTDAEGQARLAFDRPGRWMIQAFASEAYPDPATCDRSNYNATFTLVVR